MKFTFNETLDKPFLESMYGDDLAHAQEVFGIFLAETKSEFDQIKEFYTRGDLKGIRQKLHKIKPAFSFVGLTGLTEETERVIRECDAAVSVNQIGHLCPAFFRKIEDSFLLVESELERMKKNSR